ncbi:MAG: hypothetical protein IT324_02075 [Anaerolineae bacterium]|nr:hypothetical protein [Anaerolineae bacterium]
MNKRSTSTQSAAKPFNFPDVLGTITEGQRLNMDAVQVAVATRPPHVAAGTTFDAILLVQNTADAEVDVSIRLIIPEMDLAGYRGRLSTRLDKPFRMALRPGEVGYASMPVTVNAQTAPGNAYTLQIEVQAEPKQKGAARVRDLLGGAPLNLLDLPEERQQDVKSLQGLLYSVATVGRIAGNKSTLIAQFEITAPTGTGGSLPHDLGPAYLTLWTTSDYFDEAALIEQARPLIAQLLPKLNRTTLFFPLLRATQPYFEGSQFRLWAGEAIMITKLMILVLEKGIPPATAGTAPTYPRWFVRLCRLVVKEPQLVADPARLVTERLYVDLVYDAALLGFSILTNATHEQFGSDEDMASYAMQLVASLHGKGDMLDLTHAYLPLVLGGLVANERITMPQENTRETVLLLAKAREKRFVEQDHSNEFVFDMLDGLMTNALQQ